MAWICPGLIVYGLVSIVMGVLGYVNKHSVMSLVAGVAAGIIVIGAAAMAKTNPKVGFIACAVIALLMLGRFVPPVLKENQLYPAGIMVVSSLAVLLALAVAHFQQPKPDVTPAPPATNAAERKD